LAVAPFVPGGELEIAAVRTPHIGGILEFYKLVGSTLEISASIPGFSTHSIGSRNLDTAVAGDFDGDGWIEILLPDQSHQNLLAVRRSNRGADIVWSLPLGSEYSSNIAAISNYDGLIGLGIGTVDRILRLWLP